jgi:uncharacterized repeat protein (TIGR03806 family)
MRVWILAIAITGFACRPTTLRAPDDEPGPAGSTGPIDGPTGGTNVPNDNDEELSATAEFGLQERPVNTRCVARPAPPSTGALKLTEIYTKIAAEGFVMKVVQTVIENRRVFVAAYRNGTVKAFVRDNADPTVLSDAIDFLSIRNVSTKGEGGLLGLALDPDYPSNPRAYVVYTKQNGVDGCASDLCLYLSRFVVASSTDQGVTRFAASDEENVSLAQVTGSTPYVAKPADNHNGGSIAFANDGRLFMSVGDGGNQNGSELGPRPLGKMLRIDVRCGSTPCPIPADNPTVGGTKDLVYASGFRNPWRIVVDPVTGDLWVADVGGSSWEEVDRVVAGGDYGWNTREGSHCRGTNTVADTAGCPMESAGTRLNPVAQLMNSANNGKPPGYPLGRNVANIGGIYRGTRLSSYYGRLFFGEFSTGAIWETSASSSTPYDASSVAPTLAAPGQFLMFTDVDGEMYVASYSGGAKVSRIDPNDDSAISTFPSLLSQTGCADPQNVRLPYVGLIPYELNSPLWSDGASKTRFMALPEGQNIRVEADGDFSFPTGSVLVKNFFRDAQLLETRLLMNSSDGWAGYTYVWNDAQNEAILGDASGGTVTIAGKAWTYPSRAQCLGCHTAAARHALGPELSQLQRTTSYFYTNEVAQQLPTLEHIGVLTLPATLPEALPKPFGSASVESRARSYLHSNCSNCHRPTGPTPAAIDFRYTTSFKDTNTCNVDPTRGNVGISDMPKLLATTAPDRSVIARRMSDPMYRMPAFGSSMVHDEGVALIREWIAATQSCPQ